MAAPTNRLRVTVEVHARCFNCQRERTWIVQLRGAGEGLFVQNLPGPSPTLACRCGGETVRVPVVQVEGA